MLNKKIFALSLILLLTVTLSIGCTGNSSNGNSVKAPANLSYLTENQLTINTINVGKDAEPIEGNRPSSYELNEMSQKDRDSAAAKWGDNLFFFGSLVQIDGLADIELQDKINEQLKNAFIKCVDLIPPYRGIIPTLGKIPERPTDSADQYIDMSVTANFNNVLSVIITTNNWYNSALTPGESICVNTTDTLNIDLNTGNNISLTDIFCDNVDAIELSNSYISEQLSKNSAEDDEIYSMDTQIKLATPFKGIKDTQKFYINNAGIVYVFDYETPEFNTDFSAATITMAFNENMAITERYFNEKENIYAHPDSWNKTLLYKDIMKDQQYYDYEDGDICFYVAGRWSSSLPEEIAESLTEYCTIDKNAITAHMNPALEKAYAQYPKSEIWAYYNKETFADEIGNYISVFGSESMTVYQYNWETSDTTVYFMNEASVDYKLYRSGEKEVLTLEELFKSNVNYKDILKQAITKTIRQNFIDRQTWDSEAGFYDFGNGVTKEQDMEYVSSLVNSINGFNITSDSVAFYYANQEDLFQNIYGIPYSNYPDGDSYYNVGYIPFKNIGCDNLTLFD